jgi:hypothetical protein
MCETRRKKRSKGVNSQSIQAKTADRRPPQRAISLGLAACLKWRLPECVAAWRRLVPSERLRRTAKQGSPSYRAEPASD